MRRFSASAYCLTGVGGGQKTTNFDIIAPDGCRDIGEYLGISVV
jgi:hypothetical protein